jgi:hypothetical protein
MLIRENPQVFIWHDFTGRFHRFLSIICLLIRKDLQFILHDLQEGSIGSSPSFAC